jgi:hypothetical protein
MSADQAFLEPEVDALLREAAADPRSILLRVERKRAVPLLFSDESDVGPMTAGLAAIDRHLLAVHRSEVAELLRKVCLLRLMNGPRGRACVNRRPMVRGELRSPRLPDLRQQAEFEQESQPSTELAATGLDLVMQVLSDPAREEPRVYELAAVSHRLQPTQEAQVLGAMDLSQRESPTTAVRLLLRVLNDRPSVATAGCVCNNLGFAWNELGDLRKAFEALGEAMRFSEELALTRLNRLALGIQLGDECAALDANRELDSLIAADHPAVTAFVETALLARNSHRWSPTYEATTLVKMIRDQLGEAGRRIADAFE